MDPDSSESRPLLRQHKRLDTYCNVIEDSLKVSLHSSIVASELAFVQTVDQTAGTSFMQCHCE